MSSSVQRAVSLQAEIQGPRGILCTREEKEYASKRQPTVACDNRLVKREAYDASPGRETLMPLAMICLRRDIVFDSDFALQ